MNLRLVGLVGEGNANVVVAVERAEEGSRLPGAVYVAADVDPTAAASLVPTSAGGLAGAVLRLAKVPEEQTAGRGTSTAQDTMAFHAAAVSALLGSRFVPDAAVVRIDPEQLRMVAETIEPWRPPCRRHRPIDTTQSTVVLMESTLAARIPRGLSAATATSISVEIKPKWGFVPPETMGRLCRFCAHQVVKATKASAYAFAGGNHPQTSRFCPLRLFSDDGSLVEDAVRTLIDTPQNNFRLFSNGHVVAEGHEMVALLEAHFGSVEGFATAIGPAVVDRIRVLDVDPKSISKLPKWQELQRDINK
ncbi:hypothetical protein HK105_208578 [Polyrhizophydium stewartii]|uniref:Inositol-pentakisphosphate 2-kinase n=1 Tax=Polyrhizophydium stewartii TaxID=2732419 RepID=A0ABR4MXG1_9FUNG